ncbi:MAG: hypothetical protein JXR41_05700 [Bacteroidales bacterium]|nr:hypothetical protein [Bacteroidales bacterium]
MKQLKLIIIISIATILSNNLNGQIFQDVDEYVDGLKSASIPLLDYSDISNEPVKYVRVNVIFLHKDDGTGGFQPNDPYISDRISSSNYLMANIQSGYDPVCYSGSSGTLSDSKIQFDYNFIYINDSCAWDVGGPICSSLPGNLVALNNSINNSSPYPAINMFYTEDYDSYEDIVVNQNCNTIHNIPNVSCTHMPSSYNMNYDQTVHMRGFFTKYYWMMNCVVGNPDYGSPNQQTVYNWLEPGRTEAHELAHNLGLGDIHKSNCDCTEHLMMHNGNCGARGNFLSPDEIADMHKSLSQTSARRFVTETTYSSTPIQVNQNTSWSSSLRIYRGLNICNGATIQVNSELIIPSETDIVVTSYSTFSASGATIHTPHTNSTLDLTVQQSSCVSLINSSIENCNVSVQSGSLTLTNSTIELGNNSIFSVTLGATLTVGSGSIISL